MNNKVIKNNKLPIAKISYKAELSKYTGNFDNDLFLIIEDDFDDFLYKASICSHSHPDYELHVCSSIKNEHEGIDAFIDFVHISVFMEDLCTEYRSQALSSTKSADKIA